MARWGAGPCGRRASPRPPLRAGAQAVCRHVALFHRGTFSLACRGRLRTSPTRPRRHPHGGRPRDRRPRHRRDGRPLARGGQGAARQEPLRRPGRHDDQRQGHRRRPVQLQQRRRGTRRAPPGQGRLRAHHGHDRRGHRDVRSGRRALQGRHQGRRRGQDPSHRAQGPVRVVRVPRLPSRVAAHGSRGDLLGPRRPRGAMAWALRPGGHCGDDAGTDQVHPPGVPGR